jgi:hypothetical protein
MKKIDALENTLSRRIIPQRGGWSWKLKVSTNGIHEALTQTAVGQQ